MRRFVSAFTPSPRGARSIQRILDAAAQIFGKQGYQGASMHAVARAAGVSKGLLHYHFQSKEHLLIEAERTIFRSIYLKFQQRFQKGERGMGTALEALDCLWETVREMHAWAPFMVETMSLAAVPGPVREHLDGFYAEAEHYLLEGIERAFSDDLHRLAMPPRRIARLVRTTLHGLVVEMAYARTPADLERIDQSYQDMRRIFEQVVLDDREEAT